MVDILTPAMVVDTFQHWGMKCQCKFDWRGHVIDPNTNTGHSDECILHKEAMRLRRIIKDQRHG